MTLITEPFLVIGIIAVLIFYNPLVNFSIIFLFSISAILFYIFTKNKIAKWGEIRLSKTASNLKALNQAFQGIKDIKVFQKENFFIDFYHRSLKAIVRMNILNGFIKALPKYFLEFLGVIVLVSLIMFLNIKIKSSPEQIVTSISLFAAGIIKILPSISKILSSAQIVKFYKSSIDLIHDELKDYKYFKDEKIDKENIKSQKNLLNLDNSNKINLSVKNVQFKYSEESNEIKINRFYCTSR